MKGGETPLRSFPVQSRQAEERFRLALLHETGLRCFFNTRKELNGALVNKGVSILNATKKSNKQIPIRPGGEENRSGRSTQ
jgi:hypothetical protein